MTTRETLMFALTDINIVQQEENARRVKHNKMIQAEMDSLLKHFHKISKARLRRWLVGTNKTDVVRVYLANDKYNDVNYYMSLVAYVRVIIDKLHKQDEPDCWIANGKVHTRIIHEEERPKFSRVDKRGMLTYLFVETDMYKKIVKWETTIG